MIKAVLTGDIINSQNIDLTVKRNVYLRLETLLKNITNKESFFRGEMVGGDGFQCLIEKPEYALKFALLIKCFLRSYGQNELVATPYSKLKNRMVPLEIPKTIIDARIAIGIGATEFINKKLSVSDGEAFRYSGRLLEKMKGTANTLLIDTGIDRIKKEMYTMLSILDILMSKSTPAQNVVFYYLIMGLKETEIVGKLKISQSAINQRAKAGGWHAIDLALNRFKVVVEGSVNNSNT